MVIIFCQQFMVIVIIKIPNSYLFRERYEASRVLNKVEYKPSVFYPPGTKKPSLWKVNKTILQNNTKKISMVYVTPIQLTYAPH